MTTNKEDPKRSPEQAAGPQPPQEDEALKQVRMQMFDVANRIAILKNEIAEAKDKESARRERRHRRHGRKKTRGVLRLAGAVLLIAVIAFGAWRILEMA